MLPRSVHARLVTLFLVTTMFVGQVDMLARHLPDLQEGMGAVLRLRGMMSVPAEPVGGASLPHGPLDVEFRHLAFSYGTGTFALEAASGVYTEIQAGSYAFMDADYAANEEAPPFRHALFVLAQVNEDCSRPWSIDAFADHPYLAEVVAGHVATVGYDFDEAFEYGLDLILDGLDRLRRTA